jgi:hypothetical protein
VGWENRSDAGLKEAGIDPVLGASVLLTREGAGKFTSSGMRSDRECENNGETGGVRPRGGAKGDELHISVSREVTAERAMGGGA